MKNQWGWKAGVLALALSVAGVTTAALVQKNPNPADLMPRAAQTRTLDVTNVDGKFLIAVGDHGIILKSTDGVNWEQKPSPVRRMLNAVEFVDDKHGWAVGYDSAIIHTADGGETWQVQEWVGEYGRPKINWGVTFFNKNKGFVVGTYGTLKRTDDGGKTWTDVETPMGELGFSFTKLIRLNDGTLIMAAERSILGRSNDGGVTWEMLKSPYQGSWFGGLPYGTSGVLLYGLRGNMYISENVHELDVQDPDEWDEFELESVEGTDALAAMGWIKPETNSVNSYYGGAVLPDGSLAVVGNNGEIFNVSTNGALRQIPNPVNGAVAGATPWKGGLVVVGRYGPNYLK